MDLSYKLLLIVILTLIAKANQELLLNKISVPKYHVLSKQSEILLLGCDYTVDDDETGFVLKWYFNSNAIYQWIPPRTPHVFNGFKGRVDLSYVPSNDLDNRQSSLAITKPSPYDTGNYSCIVQTFQSFDEKTAPLIIIDPEASMNLTLQVNEAEKMISIECSIMNIYDISEINLTIKKDGRDSSISLDKYELEKINKYTAKMNMEELSDQSTFTCLARFNEIDYEMSKAIIYREVKTSFDPEKVVRFFSVFLHSYNQFIKFYFK